MTKAEYIEKYGIEQYEARKVKSKERMRERRANDPEYRELSNAKCRECLRTRYQNDRDWREARKVKNSKRQRERRANDPEFALKCRLDSSLHRYCRVGEFELIENYELAKADNFKDWDIHHRLELTLDGEYARSKEELIRLDMYYNRPYFELIFLRHNEHAKLHSKSRPGSFSSRP